MIRRWNDWSSSRMFTVSRFTSNWLSILLGNYSSTKRTIGGFNTTSRRADSVMRCTIRGRSYKNTTAARSIPNLVLIQRKTLSLEHLGPLDALLWSCQFQENVSFFSHRLGWSNNPARERLGIAEIISSRDTPSRYKGSAAESENLAFLSGIVLINSHRWELEKCR